MGNLDNTLMALGSFLGIVVVLTLTYLASRWFATKSVGMTQGKYIRLIDRIVLGKEKTILIVQIGNNYFLIAESAQGINPISSLDEADLIPLEKKGATIDFQSIMQRYMNPKQKKKKVVENEVALNQLRDKLSSNIERLNKKHEEI